MSGASSGAAGLREKSGEELESELASLYREKFNLRMQQGSGQDVKPHDHKRVRREIARVKTIINEKTMAARRGADA